MGWKDDHILLSKKILERIEETEGEISYSDLEQIAIKKNIDINIFDAAISHLHRFRKVTQKVKGEEIYYKFKPKPKKKNPFAAQDWLRDNYPRPTPCEAKGCHGICKKCMPFPEIDLSYLFLTPSEMLEFKAQMKGIPTYMMKRIHGKTS